MNLLKQLSGELEGLVAKATPSVVGVEHRRGQGTGWVFAPDGYLLTNSHVVRNAGRLAVHLSPDTEVRGEVVGADERTDLAVVHIESKSHPTLPLADPKSVKVGQLVVAIGNPFRFERSVSLGVVSALERSLPTPGGG